MDYINGYLNVDSADIENFNPTISVSTQYQFEYTENDFSTLNGLTFYVKAFAFVLDTGINASVINNFLNTNTPTFTANITIDSDIEYSNYYLFNITYYLDLMPFLDAQHHLSNDTNITLFVPYSVEEETEEYFIRPVDYDKWCMCNFLYTNTFIGNYSYTINSLQKQNSTLQSENSRLQSENSNLQNQYDLLDNQYNSLLEQYNLISQNDYTFSELFWSISAVPFGVLTSTFNVNVMGVNLAGIITGLLTSMVLLWLIKRLFK